VVDRCGRLFHVLSSLSRLSVSFKGELVLHQVPGRVRDVLMLIELTVGLSIAASQFTHVLLPVLPADAHSSGFLIATTSVILRVGIRLALVNTVHAMLGGLL